MWGLLVMEEKIDSQKVIVSFGQIIRNFIKTSRLFLSFVFFSYFIFLIHFRIGAICFLKDDR